MVLATQSSPSLLKVTGYGVGFGNPALTHTVCLFWVELVPTLTPSSMTFRPCHPDLCQSVHFLLLILVTGQRWHIIQWSQWQAPKQPPSPTSGLWAAVEVGAASVTVFSDSNPAQVGYWGWGSISQPHCPGSAHSYESWFIWILNTARIYICFMLQPVD